MLSFQKHGSAPHRPRLTLLQTTEIAGTITQRLAIPQSPAALLVAGAAPVQSSEGAPGTELPTAAAEAASSNTLDGAMGERQVNHGVD